MKTTFNSRFWVIFGLIALAVATRLIPHPTNFAPMGAMALFAAAFLQDKKWALFVPLFATWLSDLVINNVVYAQFNPNFVWFYEGFYWQYGAFALIALFGMKWFNQVNVAKILGGSLGASILFFVISNFGVWMSSAIYTKSFSGLLSCYAAALPFFNNTILGDAFYTGVLFGTFAWATKQIPALKTA